MRRPARLPALLLSLTLITSIGGAQLASLLLDDPSYVLVENADNNEHEKESNQKEFDSKDFKICPQKIQSVSTTSISLMHSMDYPLNGTGHWDITTPPPEQV